MDVRSGPWSANAYWRDDRPIIGRVCEASIRRGWLSRPRGPSPAVCEFNEDRGGSRVTTDTLRSWWRPDGGWCFANARVRSWIAEYIGRGFVYLSLVLSPSDVIVWLRHTAGIVYSGFVGKQESCARVAVVRWKLLWVVWCAVMERVTRVSIAAHLKSTFEVSVATWNVMFRRLDVQWTRDQRLMINDS